VKVSRPKVGFVLWGELNKEGNAYKLYQQAIRYKISIAPTDILELQVFFIS